MAALHKSTGPLSPDELKALANAPYGEAVKAIRKHDPLFGLREGQKIRWRVTFEREIREEGVAYVTASSEDEATELGANLESSAINWDVRGYFDENGDLVSVEPAP
jgi:hypothetical protein